MYVILRILKHMALVDFVTLPIYSLEQCALWDEPNIELKCQSVRRDMMFLASNSLQNLEGQK